MLTAECYKQRLERGLTFLEFNYMIMQAYDFMELNRRYGCVLELGGDDQWSNIIAGVELIRRKEAKPSYGMTFNLLTNRLDPEKTSPYDFYQYWRNVADSDVEKCLALLTFLPMDEVRRLGSYKDQKINEAKQVLAYEVTKLVHGKEEAKKAQEATQALFSGKGNMDNAPTITITEADFGKKLLDILVDNKVFESKGAGRRLIAQNGVSIGDDKWTDVEKVLTAEDLANDDMIVRKGKKKFYRLIKA